MARAPLTPQQLRQQDTKALTNRVQYGLTNGGPMGAIMGFMGLPYLSRGAGGDQGGSGSGGGFQKMWPGGIDPRMASAQPPTTGGDDPGAGGGTDPNTQAMLKAGLPPWWVDWLRTSGQYGGMPPAGGLLD